jgi:hypothetical protein
MRAYAGSRKMAERALHADGGTMSEIPTAGLRKLQPRLLLVDYDLLDNGGKKIGGGFTRIEASTGDSMTRQLNAMLSGRRFKIKAVTPIT